jgi:hypothetical protein|tara:strand:- start:1630 stop:1917 length:288 start_codon:yes stop_codon:yes gene_type:complete
MNAKQIKKLRRRVKAIQLGWMHSVLPPEEQDKVTLDNIHEVIPDQTHVYANGRLNLSFMTEKFVMKWLKQCPEIETYEELMHYAQHKNLPSKGTD